MLDLEVSTDGDEPYDFLLGAPPQVFGIYVLGPWGPIEPDPKKIRPEHWMDQGHFKAQKVVISKGHPLRVKVPLSDYFAVGDPKVFKPGLYQINVKFYEAGLKVDSPLDSGAIAFRLQAK